MTDDDLTADDFVLEKRVAKIRSMPLGEERFEEIAKLKAEAEAADRHANALEVELKRGVKPN
jgi:hypothetical protein